MKKEENRIIEKYLNEITNLQNQLEDLLIQKLHMIEFGLMEHLPIIQMKFDEVNDKINFLVEDMKNYLKPIKK